MYNCDLINHAFKYGYMIFSYIHVIFCVYLYFFTILDAALLGRSVDFGDFGPSDEEILDQTQVRSFFPETWIYDEKVVG